MISQLFSLVVAICGEEISEGAPDKSYFMLLNANCRSQLTVQLARFRARVKKEFEKRLDFFHPLFLCNEDLLSDDNVATLLKKFPEAPTDKELEAVWKEFSDCKSASRNNYSPPYMKMVNKQPRSGVYDDTEYLKLLQKDTIVASINENEMKTVNKKMADWAKGKTPSPSVADKIRQRDIFKAETSAT